MSELPEELKGKKASEVFLAYCKPLLDELKDGSSKELKILEKCLTVPWTIWNSTVLDQKKKSSIAWMGSVKIQSQGFPGGEKLIEFWKQRKLKHFGEYQYLMGDFKVIPTGKGAFTLRIEAHTP
jgi:hypothetical protein